MISSDSNKLKINFQVFTSIDGRGIYSITGLTTQLLEQPKNNVAISKIQEDKYMLTQWDSLPQLETGNLSQLHLKLAVHVIHGVMKYLNSILNVTKEELSLTVMIYSNINIQGLGETLKHEAEKMRLMTLTKGPTFVPLTWIKIDEQVHLNQTITPMEMPEGRITYGWDQYAPEINFTNN